MIVFPDIDNDFLASLYLCLILKTKAIVDLRYYVLFEFVFQLLLYLNWGGMLRRTEIFAQSLWLCAAC